MDEIFKEYHGIIPAKLLDDVKKEVNKFKVTKAQLSDILERVKKEYGAAEIEAGEAIGIITAESFGEPATQMSIVTDGLLHIKENGEYKNVKIGEFVDGMMNIFGYTTLNNFSHIIELPHNVEIYVPGLNKFGDVVIGKVTELSRHTFDAKLVKLTTKSDKTITATPYHSFVSKKDDQIIIISAKDLKIGEELPIVNKNIINNFERIIVDNNSRQQFVLGKINWDEIVKIEYVNYNDKYVYDLTVPGLETFTTFDGIVTHNTLNVKHFAGVSEMQVTSGLPRLIEIFDARKEPSILMMLKRLGK